MNTLLAISYGQIYSHREPMVFDWIKAAKVIRGANCTEASAGLRGDWDMTGGIIYRDGSPVPVEETYTFLSSTWAVPELLVAGMYFDCYVKQSERPDWSSKTYWPKEALDILNDPSFTIDETNK